MHELWELRQMQSLPLAAKVRMTENRINDWVREFGEDGVYVSFSGGKDSTVLLHIVRNLYPDVEAVFVNTGLEYPEIQKFVKTFGNVTILRPKMRFDEVIKTYGYPLISKNVSRKIYDARNGKEWAMRYVDGTAKMNNANKSRFCVEKYKPLLQTNFRCADTCCAVIKSLPRKHLHGRPAKSLLRRKWQMRANNEKLNGC